MGTPEEEEVLLSHDYKRCTVVVNLITLTLKSTVMRAFFRITYSDQKYANFPFLNFKGIIFDIEEFWDESNLYGSLCKPFFVTI